VLRVRILTRNAFSTVNLSKTVRSHGFTFRNWLL